MKPFTTETKKNNSEEKGDPSIEAQKACDLMKARAEIIARHKIVYICCIPKAVRAGEVDFSRLPEADAERVGDIIKEHTFDDINWARITLGLDSSHNKGRLEGVYAQDTATFPSLDEIAGIVIGGSPSMLSTDTDPWIGRLEQYVRTAAEKRIPLLGICFGHQLIAKTFGGSIEHTAQRELGTVNIDLTDAGRADPLFQGISSPLQALESHSEIVSSQPPGSVRLAFNTHNLNQALALGTNNNIRGVQFHPEIPKEVIEAAALLRKKDLLEEGLSVENIINGLQDTPHAARVLKNFDTYFVTKYALSDKA